MTRFNPVLLALLKRNAHRSSLSHTSLPFLATPSITQSSSLVLSFFNSPWFYPVPSPSQTHARLASSSFLALLGFAYPRRPSRSRPSDAHGAYNFHIVPSRSQPSAGELSRRLSRTRGGADEGERRPLKSSWEPITRVTQGRTHRVARHGAARCGRGTENIIAPSRARRSIKIENYDRSRMERAVEKARGRGIKRLN